MVFLKSNRLIIIDKSIIIFIKHKLLVVKIIIYVLLSLVIPDFYKFC